MQVTQGEVRVAAIDLVLDSATCKVWHVNLDTKYAEIVAYSEEQVFIGSSERTLRIDESKRGEPTILHLPGLFDEGWSIIADCARYTCRIVLYRPTP